MNEVIYHTTKRGVTWVSQKKNGVCYVQWFAPDDIPDLDVASLKWDLADVTDVLAPGIRYWRQLDWHTFAGTNDVTCAGFRRTVDTEVLEGMREVADEVFREKAKSLRWQRIWDFAMGGVMVALLLYVWFRLWS